MTLAEELQLGQAIKTALAERPGVRAVVSAGGWGCLGLSGKVAEGQQAPDTAAAAAQSRQQGRGAEEAAAAPAGPLPAHHHAKQEETEQVRSCVVQQQPVQQVFVVGDVPHDWLFPRCGGEGRSRGVQHSSKLGQHAHGWGLLIVRPHARRHARTTEWTRSCNCIRVYAVLPF